MASSRLVLSDGQEVTNSEDFPHAMLTYNIDLCLDGSLTSDWKKRCLSTILHLVVQCRLDTAFATFIFTLLLCGRGRQENEHLKIASPVADISRRTQIPPSDSLSYLTQSLSPLTFTLSTIRVVEQSRNHGQRR